MSTKTFYEILDVSKTATKREIKISYLRLALKYHPDKNQSEEAKQFFLDIQRAYAVLFDDRKRKVYDELGDTEEIDENDLSGEEMAEEEYTNGVQTMSVEQLEQLLASYLNNLDANEIKQKANEMAINLAFEADSSRVWSTELFQSEFKRANSLGVTEFSAVGKYLSVLPDDKELYKTAQTKILDLEKNNLESIPHSFSMLSNLIRLNLSSNKLTTFPIEIYSFVKLEELNLQHNKIKTIPNGISALTKIKRMNFFGNALTSISNEFSQLKNLTHLDLECNFLKTSPIGSKDQENGLSLTVVLDPSVVVSEFNAVAKVPKKKEKKEKQIEETQPKSRKRTRDGKQKSSPKVQAKKRSRVENETEQQTKKKRTH